jgi:hypothetical protein
MQLAEYLLDDTTLNQLLECATEILTSLIGFLVDNLELLVDCAVQIIEAIASYIFDNLYVITKLAVEILTALADGLSVAVYLLIDAVAKLIADMCVKFEETDWGEVGHNIINGIADGFKAGFEKVKQTFTGVWEELKQNFCDFWDIHSPSKVMENLTEYLPKGMSIGFENEIPSTIDTFNTGLDDVANSLDFDSIYAQMQGLNYSQGGVPSYSGVVQSAYSPDDTQSSGGSSESQGTVVVENYLFKGSQKLNEFVINATLSENARSGGNAV